MHQGHLTAHKSEDDLRRLNGPIMKTTTCSGATLRRGLTRKGSTTPKSTTPSIRGFLSRDSRRVIPIIPTVNAARDDAIILVGEGAANSRDVTRDGAIPTEDDATNSNLPRDGASFSGDDATSPGCVFKKGGWCNTHNLQARRTIRISKRWGAKKDGLFGNVINKKTEYTCLAKLRPGVANPAPGGSASGSDKEIVSGQKRRFNFGISGKARDGD